MSDIPNKLSTSKVWLNQFEKEHGRPLRVLHVGNIANNAYNNAKVQRQRGIEADVLCHDYYHIMGCPEWEDADFTGDVGDPFYPDWWACDLKGFERPCWFAQGPLDLCVDYLMAVSSDDQKLAGELWACLDNQRRFLVSRDPRSSVKSLYAWLRFIRETGVGAKSVRGRVASSMVLVPLFLLERAKHIWKKLELSSHTRSEDKKAYQFRIRSLINEYQVSFPYRRSQLTQDDLLPWSSHLSLWKNLFEQYDVVQMYATFPIIPLLCDFERFAAYEHGTIREIPFEENAQGRICAIGYKLAPVVFVTNSDNLYAAERLGLSDEQLYCLPHAFDNEKLFRFSDENADRFFPPSDRVVFFSPARQHWKDKDPSMAKGNDYVFYAVRELKNEGYDFALELVEWGRDLQYSKLLIRELQIEEYINWVPPMKKRQLWQKYMSVHAVIDQLLLPALGGVGFEAMTLGRRLLSAMDMKLGERFFGAEPPMLDVRDTASVKAAMLSVLNDPDDHHGVGKDAREWIKRYHSADRVCQIQVDAYRKILESKGEACA